MEIDDQFDIEFIINHEALRKFWDKLSPDSHDLIFQEYQRVKNDEEISENTILCQDNKELIIEEGTGLHYFYSTNLNKLNETKTILPQVFIDGRLCHPPMAGNIAPFCTHFVTAPFDFALMDMRNMFYNQFCYENTSKNGDSRLFKLYCESFLNTLMFKNPEEEKEKFGNWFPLLLVYKRKSNDIDVLNDINLPIHEEFLKYSHLVACNDDGITSFEGLMGGTMAILGGVNISKLEGVIIPESHLLYNHYISWFSKIDKVISYLNEVFPNVYIANEKGQLLYVPQNAKVLVRSKVGNPFK